MNSKKFSEAMSELDSKYVDEAISYKKQAQNELSQRKQDVNATKLSLISPTIRQPRLRCFRDFRVPP